MNLELNENSSWAIAYINRDFISRVESDLSKHKIYHGVKAYIPTVKILRKQFKGKDIFEEIPFLFNYGFFQLPNKKLETEFLQQMKKHVPAIHAWVKDTKTVIHTRPSLIEGNEPLVRTDLIPVATATPAEISRLVSSHKKYSIYSKDDIDNLNKGDIITLKGYPFDGMDAIIKKINLKQEKIEVELLLEGIIKNVAVSFDNVFYTVYHGIFDETDFKEKSIEELRLRNKNVGENKYAEYDSEQ